jgi:hypothetical protein
MKTQDLSEKTNYWVDARLTIAMFCTTISLVLAAIYLLSRVGFHNPLLPVVQVLTISFYILLAPFGYRFLLRYFQWESKENWLTCDSFIIIAALISLVIAGQITPILGFSLYPVFGLIGVVFFLGFTIECFYFRTIRWRWPWLIGTVLLGAFLAGGVWGIAPHADSYHNPLFQERLLLGETNQDTLFHASIANMIVSYKQPSTGLNGIPYLHYHYGSHWIFGQLATLLDISVLDFYQLGYPVIFIPLFLYALLYFSVMFKSLELSSRRLLSSDSWFWFTLAMVIISIFPYDVQVRIGILWERYLFSESYTVAISAMFILFGIVISVLNRVDFQSRSISATDVIAIIVILPLLVTVMGFCKISVMLLFMCAYGYAFLKLRLYRSPAVVLGFVLTSVATLFIYGLVHPNSGNYAPFFPLAYIRKHVGFRNVQFWLLIYLFWTLIYIIIRLYDLKIKNLSDLREAFLQNRMLDVELLVVIAAVGALPGLVFDIQGMGAGHFSDVQNWVAAGMVLAVIPRIITKALPFGGFSIHHPWQISTRHVGYYVIVGLLALSMLYNYSTQFKSMLALNYITRCEFSDKKAQFRTLISKGEVSGAINLIKENQMYVEKHDKYAMLSALRELGDLPIVEKRDALLYIAKDNAAYWEWLEMCSTTPFIAPAITGIAMVDGLPGADCRAARFFGYHTYNFPIALAADQPVTVKISTICNKVRSLGFKRVAILDSINTNVVTVKWENCTEI